MKYFGKVGFKVSEEVRLGVFKDTIVEKKYYGDVVKNSRRWSSSPDTVNDSLTVNNTISIIADKFMRENCGFMVYIEFMGQLWKISDVTIEDPRISITLGGLWNGQRAITS